jgi:deoxycytidylate deaminase
MKILTGEKADIAAGHMMQAARIAADATCKRRLCGSIIVSHDVVIGRGFNSPPQDQENQRRCDVRKDSYFLKVSDKTCCIHAEQRAILDALRHHPDEIVGSRLYFTSLDDSGTIKRSAKPYCTLCSKLALDTGVAEFVLWHDEGISVYDTDEYNDLSYRYKGI